MDTVAKCFNFDLLEASDAPVYLTFPQPLLEGILVSIGLKWADPDERYSINLINKHKDQAVHINPRVDEDTIVFNTQVGGQWLTEERTPSLPAACRNEHFDVTLLIEKKRVKFAINGQHIYTFDHGQPLEQLIGLLIQGDVRVYWIHFAANRMSYDHLPILNNDSFFIRPSMPFRYLLNEPLRSGHRFLIAGIPLSSSDWFEINLDQYTEPNRPEDLPSKVSTRKVFFHLSVRPNYNQMVRNSYDDGWQTEETDCHRYPFSVHRPFDCVIKVTDRLLIVQIDGYPCFQFKNRFESLDAIRQVRIQGAVQLNAFRHDK